MITGRFWDIILYMRKIIVLLLLCCAALQARGNREPSPMGKPQNLIPSKTLSVGIARYELTLNPMYAYSTTEAQLFTALYEGLVVYNPMSLTPEPGLAETWTLSEDKKTYTFKIRKGARFSNGDPITSETFRDTYLKLLHPQTDGAFAALLDDIKNAAAYRNGEITDPNLVGITTDGPENLIITLESRAPYFPKILCHHSFSPIHPSLLNKREWTGKDVISSGAYIMNENHFTRNPYYWDNKQVYYDTIELKNSSANNSNTDLFNSNMIDWVMEDIQLPHPALNSAINVNYLFATNYYFFNCVKKPFNNPRIREGLSLLLPWEEIRETQVIPGDSLVPEIAGFPKNRSINTQDIKKGLEILNEEGYPQGDGIPEIIISIPDSYADREISAIMKSAWEEHSNLKVSIKVTPFPDYFSYHTSENYTLGTISWIGDFADPLTFLQMWTSNSNLNESGYKNPEYDRLIKESSSLEREERYKILGEAEKLLLGDIVVIPLGHPRAINLIDLRFIDGWFPNVLDIHPFKFMKPRKDVKVIPGLI